MSDFRLNSDGQLVELVESAVPDDFEQSLQSELDAAQDAFNVAEANHAEAEAGVSNAEQVANQAADSLEQAKTVRETAQAALDKSADRRTSWLAAVELRNAGTGADTETEDDTDTDVEGESGESVSEEVDVSDRIEVVTAEG